MCSESIVVVAVVLDKLGALSRLREVVAGEVELGTSISSWADIFGKRRVWSWQFCPFALSL
jgi:hypothetical protein